VYEESTRQYRFVSGEVRVWDTRGSEFDPIFLQTESEVKEVAFSSDGRYLAAACAGSLVRLWDARTRQEIHTLKGHRGTVNCAVFRADGNVLATAGDDKTIRLWECATGTLLGTLEGHSKGVTGLAWSPDGGLLVSASADQTIRLWHGTTRQELTALKEKANRVLIDPLGRYLLTIVSHGPAKLWDFKDGEISFAKQLTDVSAAAAFSPDGRLLATAGGQVIRLWEVERWGEPITLTGHTETIFCLAFAGNQRLASGSWAFAGDGEVKLWDVFARQEVLSLQGINYRSVHSLAFSPDGNCLAVGGTHSMVQLLDGRAGADVIRIQTAPRSVGNLKTETPVAASADGRLLVTGAEKAITVRDGKSGQVRHSLGHEDVVTGLALSADGQFLASGSADRSVRLWAPATGKELQVLTGHTGAVRSVAFSASGGRLASGGMDRSARVWDAETGRPLFERGLPIPVLAVALDATGRRLAIAGEDGTVAVWDLEADSLLLSIPGHKGPATALAFSPDGGQLVTSGEDGNVMVWDTGTGRQIRSLSGAVGPLRAVAFLTGNRVTAGGDQAVYTWDLATGQLVATYRGHAAPVTGLAFHPSLGRVVSADRRGEVHFWNIDQLAALQSTWTVRHAEAAGRYEAHRQWPSAAYQLRRLVQASPEDGRLRYRSGRAHAGCGLWDQAIADYHRAGELWSDDPARWAVLLLPGQGAWCGNLLTDAAFTLSLRTSTFEAFHQRGRARELAGDLAGALQDYDEALRLVPRHAWTHNYRGGIHRRRNDWASALADLTEAVRLGPGEAGHRNNRGLVHLMKGANDEAILDFDEALRLAPRLALARTNRGQAYHQAGRLEEAVADYTEALRLGPLAVLPLQRRALAFTQQGQKEKVVADLARITELAPMHFPSWAEYARSLLVAGERDKYRQLCAELSKRFAGGPPEIRIGLEYLLVLDFRSDSNSGDLPRKIEKLLKAKPDYAELLAHGAALYRAGQSEAAMGRLRQALSRHTQGGTPACWLFLALVHLERQELAETRRWLSQAKNYLEKLPGANSPSPSLLEPTLSDRLEWDYLYRKARRLIEPE
jgi:WD40 repeat protein/tetratricopeptide (TPR) repeat protein